MFIKSQDPVAVETISVKSVRVCVCDYYSKLCKAIQSFPDYLIITVLERSQAALRLNTYLCFMQALTSNWTPGRGSV